MRPFDLFSTLNMDRRTDQQTYLPIQIQFYITVIIQEEKSSFFDFENNWLQTDGPTDRPMYRRTDQRTEGRMDGRTDPLIEMRGRIKKEVLPVSLSEIFTNVLPRPSFPSLWPSLTALTQPPSRLLQPHSPLWIPDRLSLKPFNIPK